MNTTTENPGVGSVLRSAADATKAADANIPMATGAPVQHYSLEAISSLPLTVRLELATCRISVARLLKLTPGQIIALPQASFDRVALKIGTVQFGTARVATRHDSLQAVVTTIGNDSDEST